MKTFLILTIIISFNLATAEEIYFLLPNFSLNNFIIQDGSTPYLQFYTEERPQEINLAEELETRLIEMDILRRCI